MATTSKSPWTPFITLAAVLIAVLLLSACGSSTSSDSSTNPVTTTLGGTNTASGSPVIIGFNDGSVYRFSGTYSAPTEDFEFLSYGQTGNPRVNLMNDFVVNNNHYLMAQLDKDNFNQWDGNSWRAFPISAPYPITKMVSYNNGVVAGLGDGEVWQFSNSTGKWVMLHDNGFSSAVSQMVVFKNNVVIALADGAIFQWNGGSSGQCDGGQVYCWSDLRSPSYNSNSTVTDMITYTDNKNSELLAIGMSNGLVFINDGTGTVWTNVGSGGGNTKVTKMTAFSNDNSSGRNSFMVAFSNGSVFQCAPDVFTGLTPVLSVANAGPVTQLIEFNGSIIAAYGNVLMQVTFEPGGVRKQNSIAGTGWGSTISQMLVINGELIVSLMNDTILDWNGNSNYIWTDLKIKEYSSHQLTQMANYNGHLTLGFDNGEILEWNGNTGNSITQLHDSGWGSAVEYIVNWNNSPAVGLANGAVEALQTNSVWVEYQQPTLWIQCEAGDGNLNKYQLTALPNEDGLVVSLNSSDPRAGVSPSISISQIIDLSLGNLKVLGGTNCISGNNDDYAFQDLINQLITYKNGVYAGYDDGGSVRAWDGNPAHSMTQLHDGGWVSSISTMTIFNDKLIVGLSNGAIEQWDGDGTDLSVTSWTELHDSGYGSAVLQILDSHGTMTVRFANGNIAQRLANGFWNFIGNLPTGTITQMATFRGDVVYGMSNGQIWQFDSSASLWHLLPDIGSNSAVNQLVDNGNLIAGLANGAVAQWDGSKWTIVFNNIGHVVTQMMAQ